jgi:hypothetical protein
MAEFNIINSDRYVRSPSFISGPYKINISSLKNDRIVQFGDTRCDAEMYGESVSITAPHQLNLYTNSSMNMNSTYGDIKIYAYDDIDIRSNETITLDGGIRITNTTTAMYGTEDPPSNAKIGQLYFKLID